MYQLILSDIYLYIMSLFRPWHEKSFTEHGT